MPKRHHSHDAGGHRGWSIGSNSLTAAGQSELLRDIGRQLQHNYQATLTEPAPDRIKHLEQMHGHEESEDL